ncbi:NlpC/P60 family protein [Streptomyces morookaense]|uniref:C40 family peptidase n=1 Tax=Streptomyces TaxID=1883 RepID=UPI001D10DD13|nr:C40 family peptidase [Streptomyces sp. ET3-23]MCC2277625.1 NlpC/P60 family protein [Streptomyces sp. ET3-23]
MSGRFVRSACIVVALMAGAGALVPPAAAAPPPPAQPVGALLVQLRSLYQKAEEATEAYNATAEKLKKQRAKVDKLDEDLAETRIALTASRDAAGRLAREQYRGTASPLSPYVTFLLSGDPQQALVQSHEWRRAAGRRAVTVDRLTAGEKRSAALASEARDALNVQQTLAATQKQQRDTVQKRLSEVERLLSSLDGAQLAELRRLEAGQADDAQRRFLASARLTGSRTPSAAGAKAIDFAYQQLGKPYVWGSEGPESFDCSGLTSQAWAHAGDAIPRTSQEQWASLPRVPLSDLRPGDLVLYFEGATHVALYIGNGLVIQAPRTGDRVKISPVAGNPLLGAVRPDAGAPPLASYAPPGD